MVKSALLPAFQFRDNTLGQGLSQLNSPLVKGVDAPNGTLGEDAMLIEGDEFAECFRREPLDENRI